METIGDVGETRGVSVGKGVREARRVAVTVALGVGVGVTWHAARTSKNAEIKNKIQAGFSARNFFRDNDSGVGDTVSKKSREKTYALVSFLSCMLNAFAVAAVWV